MSAVAEPRLQDTLRQAAEWRLLGLLFERPREGWKREVEALRVEVADPEIRIAAELAGQEGTEGIYLALLGPGGAVSPREVTYRGMQDPGHILADIEAFHEAFAFHPDTEEPPDHLAVEAGFSGILGIEGDVCTRTRERRRGRGRGSGGGTLLRGAPCKLRLARGRSAGDQRRPLPRPRGESPGPARRSAHRYSPCHRTSPTAGSRQPTHPVRGE